MQLLIVPYGIEMNEILEVRLHDLLLIVPYGIEIGIHDRIPISGSLLIVPYGIEIDKSNTRSPDLRAFNRTLWN